MTPHPLFLRHLPDPTPIICQFLRSLTVATNRYDNATKLPNFCQRHCPYPEFACELREKLNRKT